MYPREKALGVILSEKCLDKTVVNIPQCIGGELSAMAWDKGAFIVNDADVGGVPDEAAPSC